MVFVWISELTTIISLISTSQLIFAMQRECFSRELGTDYLNTILMNFMLPRVNTILTLVTFGAKRSLETCDQRTNVCRLIPPSNKSRVLLVKLIIAQILRHLRNTTVHYRIHKRPPLVPIVWETNAVHTLLSYSLPFSHCPAVCA
jgi:hypothetical protein